MYLFVGLGNIGKEYENTRHNFGFNVVNDIIKKYNIINHESKFNSDIYTGFIESKKIIIAKPKTYMNNSGIAVSKIKNFYKIEPQNIFVFHDDMDLDFCKIKFKFGGGNAGHNGLKSIDANIGNNYYRIRLGIGKPKFKDDTINFVIGKFLKEEQELIEKTIDKITNNIKELFKENKDNFLQNINNAIVNTKLAK